jgi:peptidoglycan/xylan/chitin deacetylase (PgdA/CDA1 family)
MENLIILLYHGVTNFSDPQKVRNYSGKHMDIKIFELQMRMLKKRNNVVSMDQVVDMVQGEKGWPKNSVAITFDDGFENNYLYAKGILEELELPATFYVCSGMINSNMMFWVDRIEDTIAESRSELIELNIPDRTVFDLRGERKKIEAIQRIKGLCKKLEPPKRELLIDALVKQTRAVPSVDHSPDYKLMSWEQVRAIHESTLFTLGAHTLYHDILSTNAEDSMRRDISLSIGLLAHNLKSEVRHFAYPEGQGRHYNIDVINELKSAGIVCCPSAIFGDNPPGADLFHLKRIMPGFSGQPFPIT